MTQTVINPGDIKAIKKWSADLARDTNAQSYFSQRFVGKGKNSIIQQKTELEADAGDTIQFDLSVQLRGAPTVGDDRLKGKEENQRFYSDQVVIDQMRKAVSSGGKMTRKRTIIDLRTNAKELLSEYWAKYFDELLFIYLSGARGINQDFIQPQGWTGHAGNAIQAPDAAHVIYAGSATSKATITSSDKMSRTFLERAQTYVRMMRATDPENTRMKPVTVDGEPRYVALMSPQDEFNLRTSDTTGWVEMNKALITAAGKDSPIFKGGLGMLANTVLHSHESVVRFSDYGVGVNLPAARSLFMGRQAAVVAYGTGPGSRYQWIEEKDDYGNLTNAASGVIVGVKKASFNGKDFGVVALDAYSAPVN